MNLRTVEEGFFFSTGRFNLIQLILKSSFLIYCFNPQCKPERKAKGHRNDVAHVSIT